MAEYQSENELSSGFDSLLEQDVSSAFLFLNFQAFDDHLEDLDRDVGQGCEEKFEEDVDEEDLWVGFDDDFDEHPRGGLLECFLLTGFRELLVPLMFHSFVAVF